MILIPGERGEKRTQQLESKKASREGQSVFGGEGKTSAGPPDPRHGGVFKKPEVGGAGRVRNQVKGTKSLVGVQVKGKRTVRHTMDGACLESDWQGWRGLTDPTGRKKTSKGGGRRRLHIPTQKDAR